jgi:aminobenzoyl-glutamate transport protein
MELLQKLLKSDNDVMKGMGKSMEMLGSYIVLVFFASQFVAYFNWTNLGKIFRCRGRNVLAVFRTGSYPTDDLVISLLTNSND